LAWRKEGDATPAANLSPIPGSLFSSYRVITEPPALSTPTLADGKVSVSWTGGGVLQESIDLKSWTNVPGNPASPFVITLGADSASKFYRVAR
jgi:hypothetical protein